MTEKQVELRAAGESLFETLSRTELLKFWDFVRYMTGLRWFMVCSLTRATRESDPEWHAAGWVLFDLWRTWLSE